jgi:hypothetical protein
MFLNEYLPKTLATLFIQHKWIFDWKRVGANKRWIVLIDKELSRYYKENKNELSLHNYGEADLELLRELLKTRHKQLTKVGEYINNIMDSYGQQFCAFLEKKFNVN